VWLDELGYLPFVHARGAERGVRIASNWSFRKRGNRSSED
jgi:hypothetical protein